MKLILSLLVATLVLLLSEAHDFDYRYQSKWYDEDDECSFSRQSPIELNFEEALISGDIPALTFDNYNLPFALPAVVSNNGLTANLQLPKPVGYAERLWQIFDSLLPTVSGGLLLDDRFVTDWGSKDSHGSEHVIDNHRYSMEMHILHRNTKYRTVEAARRHADGLVVLAVLYQVKPAQRTGFKGLENIMESLVGIKEFNNTSVVENLNLYELFGDMLTSEFYTYQGSLTTPPCSQSAQWIVFPQVIDISHEQMKRFRTLSDNRGEVLENNYRHLQAKGARQIFYRKNLNVNNDAIDLPDFRSRLQKLKTTFLAEEFHNESFE